MKQNMDSKHIMRIEALIMAITHIPSAIEFLKLDELCFTEITKGYLNEVIRIWSKIHPEKSIIFKQSPAYIKFLGPNYPLAANRNSVEYRALTRCHKTFPGLVPEPYFFDQNSHFVIMEDLVGYEDLRMELMRGAFNEVAALNIADFTFQLHKCSHKNNLSKEEFTKLVQEFKNDDMVNMTRDIIFTKPWNEHDVLNKSSEEVKKYHNLIYDNKGLMLNVVVLRDKLLQKECLLHGDLHTDSVMIKGESVKVIDIEFAHVGPAALDIGLLLANYLFSFHAHRLYPQKQSPTFHKTVKRAILTTIEHYFKGMAIFLNQTELEWLCQDTAGFIGCEMIGWIAGPAHIDDLEERPLAEVECLKLGVDLITRYKEVKSREDIVRILRLN